MDGSIEETGAVLKSNGLDKPVTYFSKRLN